MKYTDQQIVKLVVNFMQRICMDQIKSYLITCITQELVEVGKLISVCPWHKDLTMTSEIFCFQHVLLVIVYNYSYKQRNKFPFSCFVNVIVHTLHWHFSNTGRGGGGGG